MLSTPSASLNQNKRRNEHGVGDERLEGIKAYKGTMESAEQTLSFLITFIFEGRGNVEGGRLGEGNVHEEPRDVVIASNVQGSKRKTRVIDTPAPKIPSKKIACCLISLQKPSWMYPGCSHNRSLSLPLVSLSQSNSLLSIGGILEVGAECWGGSGGWHY